MKRKEFVKNAGLAMASFAVLPADSLLRPSSGEKLKVAMIGVGARGIAHLALLLYRDDVEVVAVCDIDPRTIESSKQLFSKLSKPQPQYYGKDENDWKRMYERKDIQAVIISTPWELHKPMIIGALEHGIQYVGSEVMIGITLQDHWDVVKAAENYNGHVCMLENVCYRRDVMAILNMVRQDVFGEMIHLQAGYQHDLRGVKFNDGKSPYGLGAEFGHQDGYSESRWRTDHSVHRNGDLYPTHGIGPVAHYININRGNRFLHLTSYATKSRGLHNYIVKVGGENHKNAKVKFALGDVVTTQISCQNGETIVLQHDTNLPRPYSLGFRVQGEKGLWMDVSNTIYVEGVSPKPHQWDEAKAWLEKYDHPLWKKYAQNAANAGHGGMDWFVINSFIESAKRKEATQMDVYDAAAWSAITPLSEASIAQGNKTVEIPDFTNGKWKSRQPVFALNDMY